MNVIFDGQLQRNYLPKILTNVELVEVSVGRYVDYQRKKLESARGNIWISLIFDMQAFNVAETL